MATSHNPTETEPLLARSGHTVTATDPDSESRSSNLKLLKLLPVVVLASICRGISMFSQYPYYNKSTYRYNKIFRVWVQMPGFAVRMELWSMFASFVVSFVSVGWWSSFGDQRGRKPVLFVSLMGAMLLDFIYLAVANTGFQEDGISLGLILDGLLGGFATFNGVLHAYASDVSPNSLSRTVIFGGLQAVSFIFFRFGAFLGLLADGAVPHGILGYAISGFLGCANLVYIYRLLPESLAPQPTEQQPLSQKAALKYIVLPFSLFLSKGPWRKQLVLLACSIYIYCWTLAFGGKMAAFTSDAGYFPALPRWLLLLIPSILNLLTWLCLLPALASVFQRTYGATPKLGRTFAKSVAQNSILLGAVSTIAIMVFGGPRSSPLFFVFSFIYPFSVGALPALYALGAAYFLALGRGAELGALFGALAIWVQLGEYVSYSNLDDNVWNLDYRLQWTAVFLVISLLLLVPDGPPASSEEVAVDADTNEERV